MAKLNVTHFFYLITNCYDRQGRVGKAYISYRYLVLKIFLGTFHISNFFFFSNLILSYLSFFYGLKVGRYPLPSIDQPPLHLNDLLIRCFTVIALSVVNGASFENQSISIVEGWHKHTCKQPTPRLLPHRADSSRANDVYLEGNKKEGIRLQVRSGDKRLLCKL